MIKPSMIPNAVLKKSSTVLGSVGTAMLFSTLLISPAHADITEANVQQFASQLSQAANQKNVNRVAQLVDDNVLISLSRNGKSTTLNKASYLRLLQNNWASATNYHYEISINNVVISGNQAKADVQTIETLIKNGRPERLVTTSRATFNASNSDAMLLRAVSQLTIE